MTSCGHLHDADDWKDADDDGAAAPTRDRAADPWPLDTAVTGTGPTIGGVGLREIADQYGTPVQILAEADVHGQLARYRRAAHGDDIAYAGKAFLCADLIRWVRDAGLRLDVCSRGELELAHAAGMPMDRVILHGNAKTPADLDRAHDLGVGRIVIDSRTEITQLAVLAGRSRRRQGVLVRVAPGVSGGTHPFLDTGHDGQQFGFPLGSGAALAAVQRILQHPDLLLAGLHCHLGSQLSDVGAYRDAARRMVGLLAGIRDLTGETVAELDLGGGHAVAYRAGDPSLSADEILPVLHDAVAAACDAHDLPVPRLIVEPGRAVVARAGVTVYRVISVRRSPDGRQIVAVDGGMSDNPRPSLYGAQYTVQLVGRDTGGVALARSTVVGRHCETGDTLVPLTWLPADIRAGDLMAMLCTGAYQRSMASTYNLTPRLPVIGVRDGRSRVLLRRETHHDLFALDEGLLRADLLQEHSAVTQ